MTPIPPPVAPQIPLAPEPGRIGICWRGSATHTNDAVRSMPFEACFPLFDVPDLRWQSLQFGYEVSEPLDPCPLGDFLDTAKAIARCELVISVDTSIAHLAATMRVPTWLLLPCHGEFRWLQDRTDSPWYKDSLKIWRQQVAQDWIELTTRVAGALDAWRHQQSNS